MPSTDPATSAGAGRPRRIAMLVDHLGSSYSDSVLDEVVKFGENHGLEVVCLVQHLPEFPPRQRFVPDLVDSSWADAVLVVSLGNLVGPEEVRAYCARFEPLPICTTTVPWTGLPRLLVDNEPGMRGGVQHLVETHGCRRVAFVRGPEQSAEAELRFRVYREVLAGHGLPLDPDLVSLPGHFIVQDGVEAIRTFSR
jgi:sigma-B regulation protein RsbU (phosphoserine phosphatase)